MRRSTMSRSEKIRKAVERFEKAVIEDYTKYEYGGEADIKEYRDAKRDLLSLIGVVAKPVPRRRRKKLANG